jgi:hypothetical protein
MLNLGLIGDVHLLEPFIRRALDHPEIHITGKSSVGIHPHPEDFRLSVPEFNRIELIERSDALLVNRFSLLSFQMLCSMVKKSKHFFAATYPGLGNEQCLHLAKLAQEAKTTIQVSNPFFYTPAIQWLNRNLKKPAFLSVSHFGNEIPGNDLLIQLLLMLKDLSGIRTKKTGVVSFHSNPADSIFHNLQVEFTNGLIVSINYGKKELPHEFKIRSYAKDQFAEFDLLKNSAFCNQIPIDLSSCNKESETDSFIHAVIHGKSCITGLEEYSSAMQTAEMIRAKQEQFISL